MWVKEKLLVTSNFSFFHSVFKRLVSHGRQKVLLCGNGLKKNEGQGENSGHPHFLRFLQCFPTMYSDQSKTICDI